MRRLLFSFLLCVLIPALRAESFLISQPVSVVAIALQKKMPDFAVDRLFEAKRKGDGWQFAFRTLEEKTWTNEVRIVLKSKPARSCEVDVLAVRIEGGFLWSSSKPVPVATSEWSAKIKAFLSQN